MKFKELTKLYNKDLQIELIKCKKSYFNLRFQKVSGELTDTSSIKKVKRAVARVFTALNERRNKEVVL